MTAGPREQEFAALASEESELLRRRQAMAIERQNLLAQAKIRGAEIASIDQRLLLIRGKIEGVALGRQLAEELIITEAEKRRAAQAPATTTE